MKTGDDVRSKLAQIRQGGGPKYHEKAREERKLFCRDRLALLLDADSFVEDATFANSLAGDLPADGVVTGVGRVGGRAVCVMANDSTVKAGSWGARTVEKILRIQEVAAAQRLPLFYLVDSAGARTWTPSSTDAPASIVDAEIGQAVKSHRAVGGQGIYVQTRLVKGAAVADFSLGGNTLVTATDGSLNLEIRVQAPTWAPYDRIEIYRNAQTTSTGSVGGTPTNYTSLPTQVLSLGAAEFARTTVNVHPSVPGAERYETNLTLPLSGLTQDEWVVVVVKGTTGNSVPTFPIYGSNVDLGTTLVPTNRTLVQLTTLDPNETGVRALGFTNALFVDVDGNAAFDPPGVQLAP